MAQESNRAIYASITANLIIAAAKFTGAAFSKSSAMIAEGVHSMVDASDGALLLVGRYRSRRPADEMHPFGHGKELYFWTLIVAIIFFAIGGGMSVYEGIQHILAPEPLQNPWLNYVILGVAAVFDGWSFVIALRELRRMAPGQSVWEVVKHGRDPSIYTVVLEDLGDLTGLLCAFLAVWLGHRFNAPWIDGAGSIAVGLVMAGIAVVLVMQSRALLVGERAQSSVLQAVEDATKGERGVVRIERPLSMQLGPNAVLLAVAIEFAPELSGEEVAQTIERLEEKVRRERPEVEHMYIEAQSFRRRGHDGQAARSELPSAPGKGSVTPTQVASA
jgi:cation diffusion facilitator family transporter